MLGSSCLAVMAHMRFSLRCGATAPGGGVGRTCLASKLSAAQLVGLANLLFDAATDGREPSTPKQRLSCFTHCGSFVSVLDPKLKRQSESFEDASKRVSKSAQAATILFEPGKAPKTDGNLIALDIGLAKTNKEAPERTAALERKLNDEAVERANALTLPATATALRGLAGLVQTLVGFGPEYTVGDDLRAAA